MFIQSGFVVSRKKIQLKTGSLRSLFFFIIENYCVLLRVMVMSHHNYFYSTTITKIVHTLLFMLPHIITQNMCFLLPFTSSIAKSKQCLHLLSIIKTA